MLSTPRTYEEADCQSLLLFNTVPVGTFSLKKCAREPQFGKTFAPVFKFSAAGEDFTPGDATDFFSLVFLGVFFCQKHFLPVPRDTWKLSCKLALLKMPAVFCFNSHTISLSKLPSTTDCAKTTDIWLRRCWRNPSFASGYLVLQPGERM